LDVIFIFLLLFVLYISRGDFMGIRRYYNIMGIWFKVIRPEPPLYWEDGDECNSIISDEEHRLYLVKYLPIDKAVRSLFHEFIHASDVNENVSEEDTELIARGLYQIMSDNKILRRGLRSRRGRRFYRKRT
jgi:hypothetical protein